MGYGLRSSTSEPDPPRRDVRAPLVDANSSPDVDEVTPMRATPAEDPPVDTHAEEDPGLSFDSPIPYGEKGSLSGSWRIRVVSTTPDATDRVLEENQFNEGPKRGNQFFIAAVAVTYTGAKTGSVYGDLSLHAIDATSVVYESFGRASCGVIPNAINDAGELFPGGTVRGNVCWSVPTRHVRTLRLLAQESFRDSTRRFFALR